MHSIKTVETGRAVKTASGNYNLYFKVVEEIVEIKPIWYFIDYKL